MAATFVDAQSGQALRIAPHPAARALAGRYAPEAQNRWEAMLIGYQRMAFAELFVWRSVALTTPVAVILSYADAGHRAGCDHRGEEIVNGREVAIGGVTLCRHCAHGGYYDLCEETTVAAAPVLAGALA